MDYGMHNDARPDTDKSSIVNGVKEESVPIKAEDSPGSKEVDNGRATAVDHNRLESTLQALHSAKLEDLPDEVQHITTDVVPLGLLLSRLAQYSHAKLQELILSLAEKPLPEPVANGNTNGAASSGFNGSAKGIANVPGPGAEDTSPESVDKKTMIMNVIQDLHTRWVKALVITEWARNADEVGKLIDLRTHLAEQLEIYNKAFWGLINLKHEMAFAKVPSPDLKTALEVLSTGSAHWMPDLGYLPEPPQTAERKLHWLHEIDVTLHMRLQLHEYEHIPKPWHDYKINDGRVTFTVPGEFEVDLTLSSEDFDTQLWFLDFRQIFHPRPPELSKRARTFIEEHVNALLKDEGLSGCYNYLHGLTLTTKIGEIERQAKALSHTGLWINTLKIERLNRALSIQYWAQSSHSQGSPSWIIIGIRSGKAPEGVYEPDSPPRLVVQWFRNGTEVKDVDIPFDVDTISTEKLLTTVISRHIEHLLSSIYDTLAIKPRFVQRKGNLSLRISEQPHENSSLTMGLLRKENAVLGIGTWTGNFNFQCPSSVWSDEWKQRFNSLRNPAEEGAALLERFRWFFISDRLRSQAASSNWAFLQTAPVPMDEVKSMVYKGSPSSREGFQAVWMRDRSWDSQWFAMMSMSLGGDHWWLIEILPPTPGARETHTHGKCIQTLTQINPSTRTLLHLHHTFFENLSKYGNSVMSQIKDLRNPQQKSGSHVIQGSADRGDEVSDIQEKVPSLFVRPSDMLAPPGGSKKPPHLSWAREWIKIDYKGPAPIPLSEYRDLITNAGSLQRRTVSCRSLVEAKFGVTDRTRFTHLRKKLDTDVYYDHHTGVFTLRFRPTAEEDSITLLRARMQELDSLANIVDALRRGGRHITPISVTLYEITFTYGDSTPAVSPSTQLPANTPDAQQQWKVQLELGKERDTKIVLEKGNPHLQVIDFLQTAANSPAIYKLPALLILTLPLFRALEGLQDAWNTVLSKRQGACYIFHKSLDWVTIRFTISGGQGRRVHLDIRPRDRGGSLMWHIFRPTTDANVNNENDEFNKVLKQRVWSTSGDGFKGLMNGAAAKWDSGIEKLLALISESILSLVGTPPPTQQRTQSQLPPQHAQAPSQEHQQSISAPGAQARFSHQLQQQQQPYPQQQQPRVPQQHMPQPNMAGQGQAQGQQRAGLGKNTPVVVLD